MSQVRYSYVYVSGLTSGSIFPDCLAIESRASLTSRSSCSEGAKNRNTLCLFGDCQQPGSFPVSFQVSGNETTKESR